MEHDLPLEVEADALAIVRARAPYASDGFSDSVERAFEEDPESARRFGQRRMSWW